MYYQVLLIRTNYFYKVFAYLNIASRPPDRLELTRGLYMVGNDGEIRAGK